MLLVKINNIFEDTFNELKKNYDCNYISYRFQFNQYKLEFATDPEWTDVYINQKLINNCALMRVGLQKLASSKTSSGILRWNDVLPISKKEKNTNEFRSEFNICNGISFGRKIFGASDYFGMASDKKNYDFPRDIIINSVRVRQLMDKLFYASAVVLFYDFILKNPQSSSPTNDLALKKDSEIAQLIG